MNSLQEITICLSNSTITDPYMLSPSQKLQYQTPAETSIANYHDMFGHNCFGEYIVNRIAAEIWCSGTISRFQFK